MYCYTKGTVYNKSTISISITSTRKLVCGVVCVPCVLCVVGVGYVFMTMIRTQALAVALASKRYLETTYLGRHFL